MFKEFFIMFSSVAVITFLLTVVISKIVLPILVGHKIGQSIREEGPDGHKSKAGTPTMGGICFIMAILSALAAIAIGFVILERQSDLCNVNVGSAVTYCAENSAPICVRAEHGGF